MNFSKSKVAIVRCENYDEQEVFAAVKKAIDLIGGIDLFVKSGEKILLKPNNLAGDVPDKATTTHPSILNAIILILKEKDIQITYGDSPGFEKPALALKKSGFSKIAEKYNIPLADFNTGLVVEHPDGIIAKKFHIANGVLDADGIISLPKMKTHQLTRITGAIKNQFGCVYGLNKAAYHAKFSNPTSFSKMLVDLNTLVRPRLFIMDGVVAMEGNGPRGGDPIKMNCIIVSSDPIAIDYTVCRMIWLDPAYVPTIKYGKLARLGTYLDEEIEFFGEPIENFVNKRFKVRREPVANMTFRSLMPKPIRNMFFNVPIILADRCTKCGICVNACPVKGKALRFQNENANSHHEKPPVYDYKKCIRCYCCQEMCPERAIIVK